MVSWTHHPLLCFVYAPFTHFLRVYVRNGNVGVLLHTENLIAVGFIGRAAIRILEFLFAAGIIGSAIVVVITFIEDLKEVVSKDEPVNGHTVRNVAQDVHSEAASVR